jgi:hypothetical protein
LNQYSLIGNRLVIIALFVRLITLSPRKIKKLEIAKIMNLVFSAAFGERKMRRLPGATSKRLVGKLRMRRQTCADDTESPQNKKGRLPEADGPSSR